MPSLSHARRKRLHLTFRRTRRPYCLGPQEEARQISLILPTKPTEDGATTGSLSDSRNSTVSGLVFVCYDIKRQVGASWSAQRTRFADHTKGGNAKRSTQSIPGFVQPVIFFVHHHVSRSTAMFSSFRSKSGRRAYTRALLEVCPSSPPGGSWNQEQRTCAQGNGAP